MPMRIGKIESKLRTLNVQNLADNIFAIVMTLLVFEITLPILPNGDDAELYTALLDMIPQFFTLAMSFIIMGIYWVGHHNQFHYIRHADRILIWINFLFLMTIAFMPFSAALISNYWQQQIAVLIYGTNLIASGVLLYVHWWYATSGHRLVDDEIDPRMVRRAARKMLLAPVIYAISIVLSFVNLHLCLLIYVLVPVLHIFPGQIDFDWTPIQRRRFELDDQD